MEYSKVDTAHYMVRLDAGDEIVASLKKMAEAEQITFAMIQGLGAVNDIIVGVFDVETKRYHSNMFTGNFEIVSLTGTIDRMKRTYYSHFHISVGDARGMELGGHLNKAVISATAEIVVTLLEGEIDREYSEAVGLNLVRFKD